MTKKAEQMYGISRITSGTEAWRVSLLRQGRRLVRNFPDRRYGSTSAALRAAQCHRDQLVKQYPPTTRKAFASATRRNNVTGITGVYRYSKKYKLRDGTLRELWYWEANWPTEPGRSAKATFSVTRFGEDVARQKAIRARKAGMAQVQGVFWASERAASIATPPQNEPAGKRRKSA